MKNKELARPDFIEMIRKSWTWDRLTGEERTRCVEALEYPELYGNYKVRFMQLHSVYHAFLLALGYQPIGWREPEAAEPASLF